jgi:hypothetical protein
MVGAVCDVDSGLAGRFRVQRREAGVLVRCGKGELDGTAGCGQARRGIAQSRSSAAMKVSAQGQYWGKCSRQRRPE